MNNKFYVTTAIPYVNSKPHVGFALELIQSDVVARYNRIIGKETYFLTGSDENSLKNVQAAEKEGISTQELCDKYSKNFMDLKDVLNISNDDFIRTTDKKHFKGAQKLWKACRPDDIYQKKYKGFYCVGCECFYPEKDLVDGKCPEHNTKPDVIEEENYFFKLSAYQQKLENLIVLSFHWLPLKFQVRLDSNPVELQAPPLVPLLAEKSVSKLGMEGRMDSRSK